MNTRNLTPPTTRDRRPLWNAGANRGARLGLAAIQNFNRTSGRFEIVPTYVDPVPTRSGALATEARGRGIDASGVEGRIEEFVAARTETDAPLLLNIDSPAGVARVLTQAAERAPAVLAYQIIETPDRRVHGVAIILRREDRELRERAARLFAKLGELTERSGSEAILGPTGSVAARAMEPALRRYFAAHTVRNLGKVLADLTPESAPFEVSSNGVDVAPLYIRETDGTVDAADLTAAVANDPEHPMRRGTSFSVFEITPQGVRVHAARRRAVDDEVRVRGRGLLEQAVMDRSIVEGEAQVRAAEEEAARRAMRPDAELSKLFAQVLVPRNATTGRPQTVTLSPREPIRTTD